MQNKIRTKSKSYSVTDMTNQQIESLMVKLNFVSESEAVRYCISQVHKKEYPDYIFNRSAADLEKRETLITEKIVDQMTDHQFADEFIGGGIHAKDGDGEEFYLVHGFGNTIYPIELSGIRTIQVEDEKLVTAHQEKAKKSPLIGLITPYMVQYMQKNFNIDLSDLNTSDSGVVDGESKEEKN